MLLIPLRHRTTQPCSDLIRRQDTADVRNENEPGRQSRSVSRRPGPPAVTRLGNFIPWSTTEENFAALRTSNLAQGTEYGGCVMRKAYVALVTAGLLLAVTASAERAGGVVASEQLLSYRPVLSHQTRAFRAALPRAAASRHTIRRQRQADRRITDRADGLRVLRAIQTHQTLGRA